MSLRADEAAGAALLAIDEHTNREVKRRHRAIAAILTGDKAVLRCCERDHLTSHDLDLALESWRDLVPAPVEARAALVHAIGLRSGLSSRQRGLLEALGAVDPEVQESFRRRYGLEITAFLSAAPLVAARREIAGAPLTLAKWAHLEHALRPLHLERGDVLHRSGDPADQIFVVVTGQLEEVGASGGATCTPRYLGAGAVIGEISLLAQARRSTTVRATRDSELYGLAGADLDAGLLSDPRVVRQMLDAVARRAEAAATDERGTHSIAFVPAGTTNAVDVAAFVDRLAVFLSRHRRVALVTEDRARGLLAGPLALADRRWATLLAERLDRLEADHELVCYLAHSTPSQHGERFGDSDAWARWCARRADAVVLVGHEGADPAANAVERLLLESGSQAAPTPERALVLLHESRARSPRRSQSWYAPRGFDRAHHVVANEDADLARLARLLVGRPVGLVLSGGALRGFAHIGALRALDEHGIPVDVICGTSVGAVIGAQHAMGLSPGELETKSTQLLAGGRRRLVDFTIPTSSLLGGRRLNRVLEEAFGDQRIEDLWIPLFCTISDLTAAALVVRESGLVREALRASTSLPPLFPPVVAEGHLLSDGGIMNNLPVTPLVTRLRIGTVVAVNAGMSVYSADGEYNYVDSLPFLKVLNGRFNPFATRLVAPGIFRLFLRAAEMGSRTREDAEVKLTDLYVQPQFDSAFATDTRLIPSIIQAGYEAALKALGGFDETAIPFR